MAASVVEEDSGAEKSAAASGAGEYAAANRAGEYAEANREEEIAATVRMPYPTTRKTKSPWMRFSRRHPQRRLR